MSGKWQGVGKGTTSSGVLTGNLESDITGTRIFDEGEVTLTNPITGEPIFTNTLSPERQVQLIENSITTPYGTVADPGPGSITGADPFNPQSENGNGQKKKEDPPIKAKPLIAGTSFNPDGWQLPYTPPVSPYAAPAAQDWGAWMFGSPFGGQGGLAYQPGSQEYLSQYIPQNIWGAESGLSEGVMAELAPSTGGLLEV